MGILSVQLLYYGWVPKQLTPWTTGICWVEREEFYIILRTGLCVVWRDGVAAGRRLRNDDFGKRKGAEDQNILGVRVNEGRARNENLNHCRKKKKNNLKVLLFHRNRKQLEIDKKSDLSHRIHPKKWMHSIFP